MVDKHSLVPPGETSWARLWIHLQGARAKGRGDGAGREMKVLLRCHPGGVGVTSKAQNLCLAPLGASRGDSEGLARSREQDGPSRECPVHLSCIFLSLLFPMPVGAKYTLLPFLIPESLGKRGFSWLGG